MQRIQSDWGTSYICVSGGIVDIGEGYNVEVQLPAYTSEHRCKG